MPLKMLDYLWVIGQGLLFTIYLIVPSMAYHPFMPLGLNSAIAWTLMLIGLGLVLWALVQMGRILSPFPKPKKKAHLIRDGVFALMRHPIYTGIFLVALGLSLEGQSASRLLVALLILLFFYFKSRYEERNLRSFFSDYQAYASQTGRFFPKF